MGYIDFLKEKEKERESLRKSALKEAERLSKLLRGNFEYDALILTGSVVKGKGFNKHSDIDFVIKGLKKELFFKVLSFLINNSSIEIDLKPYEELDENSKVRIDENGRVLY